MKNRASLACQVRTNIRFDEEISYKILTDIFKNKLPYDSKLHQIYLLAFFEGCYPSLIKKYMFEQQISRDEILIILNRLPNFGETYRIRKAVVNGEF